MQLYLPTVIHSCGITCGWSDFVASATVSERRVRLHSNSSSNFQFHFKVPTLYFLKHHP
ncbi:hypothetical protein M758_5G126200 [Ceratodon purpureus]|nr:hypothetical protein M758_5G126200 [Ceratodon purpureus]